MICDVRTHLDLPEHTNDVMLALFSGEGSQSDHLYVNLIKEEGHAFSFLVIKDLVFHSVKTGENFLCLVKGI